MFLFSGRSTTFYPDTQARYLHVILDNISFIPNTIYHQVLGCDFPASLRLPLFSPLYLQLLCLTCHLLWLTCFLNGLDLLTQIHCFLPLAIAKSLGQIQNLTTTPLHLKFFSGFPLILGYVQNASARPDSCPWVVNIYIATKVFQLLHDIHHFRVAAVWAILLEGYT